MALSVLVVSCLFYICSAEPTWNTLRVKWGLKVWQSDVFAKMPLTTSDTTKYGFSKMQEQCSGGKFRGYRYIKDQDSAVVLLYDSKGFIAGIQSGVPKYEVDRVNTTYPFSTIPAFQLDEDIYYRTAYFINPSTICESDRTKEEFKGNIGTGLWIQNGSDPIENSFKVDTYEDDIKKSKWTKGRCFASMGKHYWYDVKKDMNCDQFYPFFLMFNREKLTGFGFASVGNFDFSTRFEHPTKNSFSKFLDPVPGCFDKEFDKAGGFTTMHVYFTIRPWNVAC